MPFTYKLANRLARLKHHTLVGAAAAVAAAVVLSCELPVRVTGPNATVNQLIILPNAATLQLNQDQDFMAVGLNAAGDTTPSTVSWAVTGGTITDMGSSGGRHYGRYHGGACGSFSVAATSHPDGKSGAATVTVACAAPVASVTVSPAAPTVQVGQTAQLTATPKDANGTPLSGRVVAWSSNNTAAATVNGSGLVTAVAVGSATITATSEGQSGAASVTVSNVPVASVTVSPSPASVQQGSTVQLTATEKDANGTVLSGRVVTWSSNNTAVATVNGSGLVTGIAAGSATITATSEGQSGTSSVTVTPVPVASVTVTPSPASVQVGLTLQLTATPRDLSGTPLSGRVVTWSSNNTAVATVNGSGLVTGIAAGSATITATSEGKSGTSALTVVQPPPPGCTTSSTAWQNTAFATQNGSFTAQFDATPNGANIDAGTGLSLGAAASYTDLAVIVRFDSANVIDARNGGAYSAANVIPYTVGTSYHFRLVVDVPSHSYSAYVAPAGGAEATIGTGFAFRTEQSAVTALANWGMTANPGTHTVCNFAITPSTPPVPVASVTVTPSPASVQAGQTVQLTATPKDANGTPLTGRVVVWSSNNTAVATVNGSGLVSGIAAGSATITATSEGQSGTSALTVTPVPVASVTVSPATASIAVGLTLQLTATPKDANGAPLSGRVVTWSSNNTAAATVDGSGLVTAVAAGSATITATSEGQSGTASITVSGVPVASVTVSPSPASVQVGSTVQLTATPKDANGTPLTGRVVAWSSSNAAVATVNGSGLVTSVAAGSATITATSEGQSGTSALTVTPVPVASVTVSPATATIAVGLTVQLTATPKDANGTPLTGRVVTWSSNNTAVATVNGSGLVTSVAAGSATITATSEGQSGTSMITVPVPVASVTVTPSPASVQQGSTVQLTATPKDANGTPLTGRVVTWSSNNTAAATVNGTGLVTGVAAGSATITATSEGRSGTSSVTVTPVPVASVTVTPSPASVTVGLTVQLTATPKDANGTPLTGRVVTWSSNNTAVATVSGSGLVTGVAAGSATITATSEGQSGTSAVTVTPVGVGPSFGHAFIVVEENTDYSGVIGNSSMPYLNGLAQQYGLATQYYANTHPSIGNYFELSTGQILTNNDGSSTIENVPNIVRSLLAAGKTWKSYAESIPNACYLGGDTGNYARKHNIFALLSDVANDPVQACNNVPFTQFATDLANGTLPTFSNIVPNLCNDAHDCSLGTADTWLKNNIDPLIKSPVFQTDGLLIIVFDEASTSDATHGGGRVVWVAVSPKSKPAYQSTTLYQHQSTLRLMLKGLGVTSYPGAAATAPDMDEFFNP